MRILPALAACAALSAAMAAQELSIGAKVAEITVTDGGAPVTISTGKTDATVVIFISTKCPISNSYNDRMNALQRDYSGRNIRFAFVNANANEPVSEIDEHAKANQFTFKVYKDVNNALANQFGATVTPECYVFDKAGVLQYHGYVDDSTNAARIHVQGLRKAIDAVLAGKPVELKQTKAFGCTIKKVRKTT